MTTTVSAWVRLVSRDSLARALDGLEVDGERHGPGMFLVPRDALADAIWERLAAGDVPVAACGCGPADECDECRGANGEAP